MMTLIIILLALCAIGLFYTAARSRKKRATQHIRPIDMKAFRAITSRDDEIFLRRRLPRSEFSRLKRKRIHVTALYVKRMANNAAIVMRMGEMARTSANPDVAHLAAQISETASQIRIQCIVAFVKLSIEFAVPSLQLNPAMLEPSYQALRENIARLGRLQNAAPLTAAI
jgi:LPS O-antigen subunit length determinant protein (WzzB/FepE family)